MENHPERRGPARLLVEALDLLPVGKGLDIAMGSGRNALYLASKGLEVEGLDRDPERIMECRQAARDRNLEITARQLDLEKHTLDSGAYEVIVCFYYLQRSLLGPIKKALKPGGIVVYETFSIDNHIQFGHPRPREFCLEHNELLNAFRDFRILFYREGLIEDLKYVVQLIAEKV